MTRKKYGYLFAVLPFLLVSLMYEIIPLSMVLIKSFLPDEGGSFTLVNYKIIFTKLLYQRSIYNSIRISLLSSAVGILIAVIGAKAAHAVKGRGKTAFMLMLNMVSNFAGIPLAFAYMILLGNEGVLVHMGQYLGIAELEKFQLYTSFGMSIVYIYFQIPLATLLLIPCFDALKKEWSESAQLLGGSPFLYWRAVAIPVLIPEILGTFCILFANALAAYATVYALMMSNFPLLPVEIASSYVGEVQARPGLGGALSVVMMGIIAGMITLSNLLIKKMQKGGSRRG